MESDQEQFKVAPIISDQKEKEFKQNILQTLLGIHSSNLSWHRVQQLIILFPLTFILPLVVSNKIVAILVPTIVNTVLNLVEDFLRSQKIKAGSIIMRNIVLGIYTFLWANHIYFLGQYANSQVYNIILSGISIATSIYTIARQPVKEFAANGFENSEMGWNSTLYMRFFVAFPTLLAEFIIFNSYQTTSISPANIYLFPLRLINSLIFVVWWLGWLSSLRSTLLYICNSIGTIIFGNESHYSFGLSVSGIVLNLIPIMVFDVIYYRQQTVSLNSLIIGATLTSIATYLIYSLFLPKLKQSNIRSILLIVYEMFVCATLALIYSFGDISSINLSTLLGIDIGLYFFFKIVKQLCKGWSHFGLNINLRFIKYRFVAIAQRITLRIFSGLSILFIINNYSTKFLGLFNYNLNILAYAILPFLAYRAFKRSISQTKTFSLHISLLICLILVNSNTIPEGTLLVLMMPPFPPNAWVAFISIFRIPPKLKHKNQCLYQVLYFVATLLGLALHYLSFGTLEMSMIFGLPIYFPTIPTQTEGNQIKSVQNSLYQKILKNIDLSQFWFLERGYYLLRIQKYILLLEVKSNCFGFCELIDLRGLQVQEVTSCHSKEGETIDKLVEETWGDNRQCLSLSPLDKVLNPFLELKVTVPTQNDIQLTGIIESKDFVKLFKQTALKSIVRQFSKVSLSQNQKREAQVIMSEFSAIYKKQQAQSTFPSEFASKCNIHGAYPTQSGKVKLPPLTKGKKAEVINDFLDLLQSSHNQKFESSLTGFGQKANGEQTTRKQSKQNKVEQINLAIILTFYYYTVGKQDYVNTQKLYKLIKRQSETVTQIEFQNFSEIISLALGAALKISIDKYIQGEFEVNYQDFLDYQKTSFLGTSDSDNFKKAILEDKQHVWTVSYSKKSLAIKRLAHSQTKMFVFQVDEMIIKSVWNNLRFELIYATNNNDERYSIQTHPNLMRNLWVQACQEPFGYPSYHSGIMINN